MVSCGHDETATSHFPLTSLIHEVFLFNIDFVFHTVLSKTD